MYRTGISRFLLDSRIETLAMDILSHCNQWKNTNNQGSLEEEEKNFRHSNLLSKILNRNFLFNQCQVPGTVPVPYGTAQGT